MRVEPELRAELEAVLKQGETLSASVEASVRSAVELRRVQTRFHERGKAAWQHYQRTGVSVPADDALASFLVGKPLALRLAPEHSWAHGDTYHRQRPTPARPR